MAYLRSLSTAIQRRRTVQSTGEEDLYFSPPIAEVITIYFWRDDDEQPKTSY